MATATAATGLPGSAESLVLIAADHLALVGDGLHVILILVARLVQGMLGKDGDRDKEREKEKVELEPTLCALSGQ